MKDLFRKLTTRRTGSRPAAKRPGRKSTGQSLVEIAIALPLIILLISGIVEFGFIINFYLSLLDATRESARFYANFDAFEEGVAIGDCTCPVTTCLSEDPADAADVDCDRNSFYSGASAMVIDRLRGSDPSDPLINTDPATDDVIITVFTVDVEGGTTTVLRSPEAGSFRQYGNFDSKFTDAELLDVMETGGDPLVDTGVLLVEVYWGYEEFFPTLDPILADPVMLHAYTVMPLASAAPVE